MVEGETALDQANLLGLFVCVICSILSLGFLERRLESESLADMLVCAEHIAGRNNFRWTVLGF